MMVYLFHHLNTAEEGDINFGLITTLTDQFLETWHFDNRSIGSRELWISSQVECLVNYLIQPVRPFRNKQYS